MLNRIISNLLAKISSNLTDIFQKKNIISISQIITGLSPKKYITCCRRSDGIGAQVQGIISTIAFSQKHNLAYVHTPFSCVGHNSCKSDQNFEKKWESFFKLDEEHKQRPNPEMIHTVPHCHDFMDNNPDNYNLVMPELRKRYYSSHKPSLKFYNCSMLNVAVHIRRGDARNIPKRYTPDEEILSIITQINTLKEEIKMNIAIHIFSEGNSDDFKIFTSENVFFHISEDVFLTLHHLISADILIMAKSSFSYIAALYSTGIIIYEPFWHKPLSTWIIIDTFGRINEMELKNKIFDRKNKSLHT